VNGRFLPPLTDGYSAAVVVTRDVSRRADLQSLCKKFISEVNLFVGSSDCDNVIGAKFLYFTIKRENYH